MSDILIKNMKMPEKGNVLTLYLCSDGYVGYQDEEGLHKAKAVALPSHGRLIDADELEAGEAIDIGKEAWDMVHNAPTVLEANYE